MRTSKRKMTRNSEGLAAAETKNKQTMLQFPLRNRVLLPKQWKRKRWHLINLEGIPSHFIRQLDVINIDDVCIATRDVF
jgi:hypothetical protein